MRDVWSRPMAVTQREAEAREKQAWRLRVTVTAHHISLYENRDYGKAQCVDMAVQCGSALDVAMR